MNTKNLPALIMLIAGFMTCVIQIMNSVDTKTFLTTLFVVLICFYIIGSIVKVILDRSFKSMGEEPPLEESANQDIQGEESKENSAEEDSMEEKTTETIN